ncbi:MAG: hypothetical protein PCFJNLEI_00113 [Verrucomicrobiae bacterium]|nr:hypothetical protein [Verrucomicrobiae bacterium]
MNNQITVTDAQRQQYAADGYFITDVVFDEATLAGIRQEFKRMWAEEIEKAKQSGEKLALDWAMYRPHMAQLDHRSPTCHAFCHHPVFADLCRQTIGPDADLVWNQAIVKAAMPKQRNADTWDNVFGWHQDIWYALNNVKGAKEIYNMDVLREPNNAITCWCAISRTTVDNGTLWVVPGAHKNGLIHHNMHEARKEWQAQLDTAYRIPVVLRPGQVLVFNKYLPHCSGTNNSDETRMAYQIGYTAPGLYLKPSADNAPLMRAGKLS